MKLQFKSIVLTIVLVALLVLTTASSTQPKVKTCSNATLQGAYGSNQTGTLNGLPFAQVNRVVSDGNGNVTGSGTAVVNGVVSFPTFTATYTVNSDCTGSLTSVTPPGLTQNFVIERDGSEVLFIVTAHPAGPATISGNAINLDVK
jgi:hypothetical protein